jgi:hypothetical protein
VRPCMGTHPLRSPSDRRARKCGGKCGVSASDRYVSDVRGCDDSFRVRAALPAYPTLSPPVLSACESAGVHVTSPRLAGSMAVSACPANRGALPRKQHPRAQVGRSIWNGTFPTAGLTRLPCMHPVLMAGLLGAGGGLLLELVELARFLKRHGHLPWSAGRRLRAVVVDGVVRRYESGFVYLLAVVVRMVVGGGVAAALSLAGPLNALGEQLLSRERESTGTRPWERGSSISR